ncbi:hypothetical protein FUA23_08400 [Neolewinella aurantiaca]|uniref:HTH luxR-type domain-containing protein n=1 Tax=Neolewinella aurantiaca TaxID=2602767 RepID=A0A5C7FFH9_9BACT|nr:hypothetical protein [Neolewinella aurantiaca]TXF89966.1 hypothetical protein FUA23_08400 [Neolewinella aurantiaca]
MFIFQLLYGVGTLYSQPEETPGFSLPKIVSFPRAEYSGEGQIWDIATDEKGIMYLANASGVLRYDGAIWTELYLPGGPTVRALAAVGDRLYAGGYGEFGYFQIAGDEPSAWVSLSASLKSPDREEEIWNIEVLETGEVVFQSFGRLFVYDGTQTTTVVPPGVMMFAVAAGPDLLVPVTGRGVFSWRVAEGFRLLPGSAALGDREVVSIIPAPDQLILGTADSVLGFKDGQLTSWDHRLNEQLAGTKINRLALLQDSSLAVGTIGGGLILFGPSQGKTLFLDEASGLRNNTILALNESKNGNLWLGLDRGLDLMVRSSHVSFVTGKSRPPGTVYTAAYYDGKAYFGTNQGLYLQQETATGFTYTLVPGTSGQVWELRETDVGLLCGHNDGTFLVRNNVARKISARSGGWMTVPVPGSPEKLLQATYTGLQLLEWAGEDVLVSGIAGLSAPIRQLEWVDQHRLLALHSSQGAFLLTMSDDARQIEKIDTLTDDILSKTSSLRTSEGILLQSAQGRRLFRNDSLLAFEAVHNVPLMPGEYFIGGQDDAPWFIAGADRVKIYRKEKMVAELPMRLRFPYPGIIPWTDGQRLFLLDEGYATVKPGSETTDAPPMILRASLRSGAKWRPFSDKATRPRIAFRNNDLRFSAALPVFDRTTSYRSRLNGYANEWSAWSKSGERGFTNLPEGDYLFEVEANWFGKRETLAFTILPPWYRSRLAYVLYALALCVALWVLYQLHLQRLRNQARRMEVIRQREVQRERIVARNRELNANLKRKSRELANTTLTLAKKNEMLLALKEELAKGKRNPSGTIDHRKVDKLIDRNLNNEEDWSIFESHFNEVHEAFLKRLRKRHPELTAGDLKLAAYLRMDLSSKEIAPLLHISLRGVENKRYRLRKKIGLESGDDLNRYLLEF